MDFEAISVRGCSTAMSFKKQVLPERECVYLTTLGQLHASMGTTNQKSAHNNHKFITWVLPDGHLSENICVCIYLYVYIV